MKTVGQILQKNRIDKGISLEQVASQTKIRQDILLALENDDFQKISSLASIKGLLKSYADFLNLSSEQILAVFRRDFGRREKKKVIPVGLLKPISQRSFDWSPKKTLIASIIFFFLVLVVWLVSQYLSLVRPPFLKVDYPPEGAQVQEELIEISGQADKDALVTINMETVLLSSQGDFHQQISLFPGENNLVIEAVSKNGQKNKIERIVFFQAKE
jgi:cytoskeletal protein RodZ